MSISIILPVRNGAATLSEALESLFNQSLKPLECIVIDDGSTDATPGVLKAWLARWPALRVFRTPGMGISGALNLGLQEAKGDLVARMDADDACHPSRLKEQAAMMLNNSNLYLASTRVTAGEEAGQGMLRHLAWSNAQVTHEQLALSVWIDSPLPHPTWLVRRQAYDEVGQYTERGDAPEDYEWLHRFFRKARRNGKWLAGKVAAELVLWRDSPERLTRKDLRYSEAAFNRVKAESLQELTSEPAFKDRMIILAGLGPKGKAMLFALSEAGMTPHALVDTSPRREGARIHGIAVWSVDRWRKEISHSAKTPLMLNCVGTSEARAACEQLCRESGLNAGDTYLSL